MKIKPQYEHEQARRKSYPETGEQLDAIYKTFLYLHKQGIDIGPDGRMLVKRIYKIKKGFPKPEPDNS